MLSTVVLLLSYNNLTSVVGLLNVTGIDLGIFVATFYGSDGI